MKPMKISATLLMAGVLALAPFAYGDTASDAQIQGKLAEKFSHDKALQDVHAAVQEGAVTLQGSVPLYQDKLKAEKEARKAGHVSSLRDLVQVAGPEVSDAALAKKLANSLAYERVGYGNAFNAVSAGVNRGVVTLTGVVRTPTDEAAYLDLVQRTPGVKDVVNKIEVAPLSTFDDQLRIRLARAIYGDPVLSRYAIDPAAPIRIVVENGHVALYGTVDNNMDRQIAGIRASQVFGAFGVDNKLMTSSGRQR